MKNERNEKNIRLLIADDDQTLLDETHRALEGCGFRVHQMDCSRIATVRATLRAWRNRARASWWSETGVGRACPMA